eukprot:3043926-Prymnesium_polylepis.1
MATVRSTATSTPPSGRVVSSPASTIKPWSCPQSVKRQKAARLSQSSGWLLGGRLHMASMAESAGGRHVSSTPKEKPRWPSRAARGGVCEGQGMRGVGGGRMMGRVCGAVGGRRVTILHNERP